MLRLEEVSKSFGQTCAVDGLSLTVEKGEVFGLLGPNGAGKTTTIAMATGQLAPDSGTVAIGDGGSPRLAAVRKRIGVAPQSLALYDELSGAENLFFFGRLYGLRGKALSARVRELLERTGLEPRRSDRVAAYSGGMKRRLNLAVALLHAPPLLLLDEPTAGVDPQSRNAIFDLVKEAQAAKTTVVYTTHYMEEAQRLCDRVGIVDHGKLLALDTVDGLLREYGGDSVVRVQRQEGEERIPAPDPLPVLTKALSEPGVSGVEVVHPDLESVFLSLTGRSLRD